MSAIGECRLKQKCLQMPLELFSVASLFVQTPDG